MNRAFFSLYFLVVVSVVLVGWGTDKLWQVVNPEPRLAPFELAFFSLAESEFKEMNFDEAVSHARHLSQIVSQDVGIYSLEELATSSLSQQITQGDIVTVFDDNGRKSSYKRIANTDYIVRVQLEEVNDPRDDIYIALLITFYLVIAIIIYFWIWPLSRDLRKLQLYTQRVGIIGVADSVELSQGSAVYSLAAAFNKMTERIHELIATNREMTYAVSHELRTPLARMKFALEMAKDSADHTVKERQTESVRADVAEMDRLVNELLAYASFEQRYDELEFKRGDLNSLIENILGVGTRAFNEKDVVTKCTNLLEDNKVCGEWYLLERCMHNVIQNAFKYCHQKIQVTLRIDNKDGVNHCYVVVEDDGPGISEDDAQKVFKAFVRLRNETSENKSGFGLGLAIVHRIMKWHSGGVHVDSSAMGGAKFTLFWPLKNDDDCC